MSIAMRLIRHATCGLTLALGFSFALTPLHAVSSTAAYVDLVPRQFTSITLTNGDVVDGQNVSIDGAGTLTYTETDGKTRRVLKRPMWVSKLDPLTLADAIRKRGFQALARADAIDLESTLNKAIASGADEQTAGVEIARKAVERFETNARLRERLVVLLRARSLADDALAAVRAGLDLDRHWAMGWKLQMELLQASGDKKALLAAARQLLDVNPTERSANELAAQLFEDAGAYDEASKCLRRLYEIHSTGGVDYARLLLRAGQAEQAAKVADQCLTAGTASAADAQAIKGSGLLLTAAGNAAQVSAAATALDAALAGSPTRPLRDLAAYNRGVIAWRAGDLAKANSSFADSGEPAAKLGLAMANRQPFRGQALAPELHAIANEYAACLALERIDRSQKLDPTVPRQAFLARIATMLGAPGVAKNAEAVAAAGTPEALRWAAYGHLIAKRFAEADALLARLPVDDPYAAVYRIAVAQGRGDTGKAQQLWLALPRQHLPAALSSFVQNLDIALQPKSLGDFSDEFDRTGPAESNGWSFQSSVGITASLDAGRAMLKGTQTAGPDPVSRLTHVLDGQRLSSVTADLDLTGIAGGIAGLELMDESRAQAIALGVMPDLKLAVRERSGGTWGSWQTLPIQLQSAHVQLRLEYAGGRITAIAPGSSHTFTQSFPRGTRGVVLALFGVGTPGSTWSLGIERVAAEMQSDAP